MTPDQDQAQRRGAWSLSSRGTVGQFIVALVLISLIPLLAFVYVLVVGHLNQNLDGVQVFPLVGLVLVLLVLGYAILLKYPVNIIRLRSYLETLAQGGLPDRVELLKDEQDLDIIESSMYGVLRQTEARIHTIEAQTEALLAAERQRVMIESLGAACHHLSQPMTVMIGYMEALKLHETGEEKRQMISRCQEAGDGMRDILQRLRCVVEYRTEPYITSNKGDATVMSARILKI